MGKVIKFRGSKATQEADADAWMFDGLEGLAVVIEDLDAVAVEAGLNRTNIQLHIEERLSDIGIPVAPLLGAAEGEAVAVLYVALDAEPHSTGLVACQLSLQVCEAATLARNPELGGGVITWLNNGAWASLPAELERDTMEGVDEGLASLGKSFLVGRDV